MTQNEKEKTSYLLFHLGNLELMITQLGIVHHLILIPIALGDDALHLPDQRFARIRDCFASRL